MSTLSLYASTAPVFTAMLDNLSTWLDKAEAHARAKNVDAETYLQSSLAPDMFPLSGQISMMTAFAKNTMRRLAGEAPPDFPDAEKTIADFRTRIARARDIVVTTDAAKLDATRKINVRTGPETTIDLTGVEYLTLFALPNFFFHATTAYDILRHNGVQLGKRDFLPKGPQ